MTTIVAPRLPVATPTAATTGTAANPGTGTASTASTATTAAPVSASAATDAMASGPLRQAFDASSARSVSTASARVEPDNMGAWNARWDMLAGASKRIDTTYFTVDNDAFGMAFVGHLLKKQRSGVPVRLMFDGMADAPGKSFKLWGRECLNQLVRDGGEVRVYSPVHTRLPHLGGAGGYAQNHDKILVVDGERGITGGRNIGGAYFSDPTDVPTAWRDTDVVIDGAGAASGLLEAIDAEWNGVANPVGEGIWQESKEVELIGAYLLMDLWLHDPALSPAKKTALRGSDTARDRLAQSLVQRAVARLPAEGVTRTPDTHEFKNLDELAHQLVDNLELCGSHGRATTMPTRQGVETHIIDRTSARVAHHDDFAQALIATADNAQTRLVLQNPYVVLTKQMLDALERAATRGVKITIVTNSPKSTDSALTQTYFLRDWPEVLARLPNAQLFVFGGERKMHAKVAVADDDVSLVSTYNLDLLSSQINGEVGSLMWSRDVASDVAQSITNDLKDPRNVVVEYTIQRDVDGKAMLMDGKPIVVQGPASHVDAGTMRNYRLAGGVADLARRFIPGLGDMQHNRE